jgi:hypothetical protein
MFEDFKSFAICYWVLAIILVLMILFKNKLLALEARYDKWRERKMDLRSNFAKKKAYTDRMTDCLNAYLAEHNNIKPKYVFISTALFDLLTDGKGKKSKSKFCGIRVKVYGEEELEFSFGEDYYVVR